MSNPNGKRKGSLSGGTFDGRYVYFTPSGQPGATYMIRYDTEGAFDAEAAWSVFNFGEVNRDAYRFAGAVFDGRYVYYAPNSWPVGCAQVAVGCSLARYDTQGAFDSSAAWSSFSLVSRFPLPAPSFNGALFDGRYVYFVPENNHLDPSGRVVRYDSQASFDDAASWALFDTTSIDAEARGFKGGVFDGHYLYLAPNGASEEAKGRVTRLDTSRRLDDVTSWSTFDTTAIDPRVWGFTGATFDGRYVYFSAGTSGINPHGRLVRYDTQGGFDELASWSTFSTGELPVSAQAMGGAVFDGRFVHFVPGRQRGAASYDTLGDFSSPASWLSYNAALFEVHFGSGVGGVFDGRYVYLIPEIATDPILRFAMKTSAATQAGPPLAPFRLE